MFDLNGRVAIVTGGASGLGRQFALALSGRGAAVALLDVRQEALAQAVAEITRQGGRARGFVCDVRSSEAIAATSREVISAFGTLDILVNNAGISRIAPLESVSDDDWNAVISLNLSAMFTCCREFGKIMLAKGYGRIINIASAFGAVGNGFCRIASYHASKGGVINFTRALGAEWAKRGVAVNAIAPGYFLSNMTAGIDTNPFFKDVIRVFCPLERPGRPHELDGAIVFLASEEASYCIGSTIFVDGGWTAI